MSLGFARSTYEPIAGRTTSNELELDDIISHEAEPHEDDRRLLGNASNDDGQVPLIKRAYSNLAHGHNHPKAGQKKPKRAAWRAGIRWVTAGASVILVLNIATIITIPVRYGITDGVSTFYTGSCSESSQIDTGLHMTINILSTLFLSASNYVMQILNAPSRERVSYWHARGSSLHIGIPSFSNAWRVPPRQSILWFLLGISAIPLHLLWNSAVFATVQTNEYNIFLVSSDFNTSDFSCNNNPRCDQAQELHSLSRSPGGLEYLDTASCIQKYSVDFLQGRGNLLLVGNTTQITYPNGTVVINESLFRVLQSVNWLVDLQSEYTPMWLPNSWWCGTSSLPTQTTSAWNNIVGFHTITSVGLVTPQCSMADAVSHAAELEYYAYINGTNSNPWGIDYCLSQPVPEVCTLGFAVYIMATVIACNIVKVASMIASFWVLDDEPLVIIGDALSSFLEEPEMVTKGRCLAEARHGLISYPETWHPKKSLWMHTPTTFSIIRCFLCCLISLAAAALLLVMGLNTLSSDFGISFSSLTFGAVNPSAMIQTEHFALSFTSAVLVANAPQLLFSTLYFMYNRLLTAMLSMDEWSRFSHRRAKLRVSYPTRGQRSSYWLQLPYTYGIPLLIATSTMHWLVSQSLYLARIDIYDSDGKLYWPNNSDLRNNPEGYAGMDSGGPVITSVGYSPKAIVACIAVGSAMLLALVVLGFRRYRPGMVLIGNNSLAISAACHRPEEDNNAAHSKLLWGAVSHDDGVKPGHCCLTSTPVTEPIDGHRYA